MTLYDTHWWNRQFRINWQRFGGPAQARYFMNALVENLRDAERQFLQAPVSILDIGCATGEGADVLASAFPHASVSGLDVAEVAIDMASRAYEQCEFIVSPDGALPRDFDVMTSSNCLEHFSSPLEIMKRHLASCNFLYLALVPFEEFPLLNEHLVTFTHESFPRFSSGFVKLQSTDFASDPQYWSGRQLLVTYGSIKYLESLRARAKALPEALSIYCESPAQTRSLLETEAEAAANAQAYSFRSRAEATHREAHSQNLLLALEGREKEVCALQEGITGLRADIEVLQSERDSFIAAHSLLSNAVVLLEEQSRAREVSLEALTSDIVSLQKENSSLREGLRSHVSSISFLQDENRHLMEGLAGKNAGIEVLQSEIGKLREALSRASSSEAALAAELRDVRRVVDDLHRQLSRRSVRLALAMSGRIARLKGLLSSDS